jgi:hypothetical protein
MPGSATTILAAHSNTPLPLIPHVTACAVSCRGNTHAVRLARPTQKTHGVTPTKEGRLHDHLSILAKQHCRRMVTST